MGLRALEGDPAKSRKLVAEASRNANASRPGRSSGMVLVGTDILIVAGSVVDAGVVVLRTNEDRTSPPIWAIRESMTWGVPGLATRREDTWTV